MGETAVASLWEPRLAANSLPGGLPWPTEDETPISSNACKALTSPSTGYVRGELWAPQPVSRFDAMLVLSPDDPSATRTVHYARVGGGITTAVIRPDERPDALGVYVLIDRIKTRLGVTWRPLLDALGYPYRTFFTHRKQGLLQGPSDIGTAVRVLAGMADQEAGAVRALINDRGEEVRGFLSASDFVGLRQKVRTVARDLREGGALTVDPQAIVAEHLDALRTLITEPAFALAARAIEGYATKSATLAGDRMIASVDLEVALREARRGDDLEQKWDFLPSLTFVQLDAFRARAQSFIGSDGFTPAAWAEFVTTEADRAWTSYAPLDLPPDPVEPPAEVTGGGRRRGGLSRTERLSR